MRTLIKGGTLVNENKVFDGSIVVGEGKIAEIVSGKIIPEVSFDEVIDAS